LVLQDDDPWIGTVVANRYQLVHKLGEGGMSVVYESKHVKLARQFAIKRLLPQLMENEEALQRFEREAEMLATLRHPNVVEVNDWDYFPDGAPCMVLEYLHGANMSVRLARGIMAWEAIAKIGDQTMSALTLAHRNGITHRDLKPDNIFIAIDDLGDERVKLLDFGVSKLRGVNRATSVNAMLGTPAYMSPEQASGQTDQIGPWTDVWAMSAMLYEMVTGRRAFGGTSIADTLMMIVNGQPEPMQAFRPDVPQQLVDLFGHAMTKDPTRRIQSIEELRAGLREALDPRNLYRLNTPIHGTRVVERDSTKPKTMENIPLPPPQVVANNSNRMRWIGIASIVAVLVTIGVVAILFAT
jgi:serine/threonine-protein kinase